MTEYLIDCRRRRSRNPSLQSIPKSFDGHLPTRGVLEDAHHAVKGHMSRYPHLPLQRVRNSLQLGGFCLKKGRLLAIINVFMKKFAIAASAYLLPLAAFATDATKDDNLADLIFQINAVINTIIPFLVGLAVLIIIWGVFNYISGAGDEEKRAQAKQYIVWGVVGVFIMLSVWGLVNVLVNSFDLRKSPLDAGPDGQ